MGRKDRADDRGDRPEQSGDADSTNLVKRLIDNQPLSDTHKARDESLGEHRQYGMRDVDSPDSADDAGISDTARDG